MRFKTAAAATVLTVTTALPLAAPTVLATAWAAPAAVQPVPGAPGGSYGGNPTATVSPGTVSPGSRVSLNVEGCGTRTGRATSSAFGEAQLSAGNMEASNLFGSATVYRSISPGSHPVTFECGGSGGRRVTVNLYVTPGAARGGLGGSVDGPSTGQIAMGGALVAGALGAGVWYLRRRNAAA
ncbi:hypothetical protein [Streptomyces sp. NPDC097619]|uniref:hypothetical protein n=1 Tax=Streptomyces sp. NPDC097619 TaxID=3157228 RepID=UPI0033214D1C